jgi:site-specific DNA-methyltransferase (adenine-specific)
MVQLFCGDCLEIMPMLASKSVDAIITDPPYPNLKGGLSHMIGGVAPRIQPSVTVGTPWGNELEALREFRRVARFGAIVFCSWHAIGQVRDMLGGEAVGLVTWYKRNSQPSLRNRPHYTCEYAWLIEYSPGMNWHALQTMYDIPGLPAGCFASERILQNGSKKAMHPTQKPVSLMMKLIEATVESVLDPFMGTGTTGVACVKTGCDFIGIEIDKEYFAIAEKRITEAQAQVRMELE